MVGRRTSMTRGASAKVSYKRSVASAHAAGNVQSRAHAARIGGVPLSPMPVLLASRAGRFEKAASGFFGRVRRHRDRDAVRTIEENDAFLRHGMTTLFIRSNDTRITHG
jgi:hypothetical protein